VVLGGARRIWLLFCHVCAQKHNRSGSISVVVVSKANGKYKKFKTFGTWSSEVEIKSFFVQRQ